MKWSVRNGVLASLKSTIVFLSSVCLPTYLHIYLSIHLVSHVCVLCAEARGRCQVSVSITLYLIVLGAETLTELEVCSFG